MLFSHKVSGFFLFIMMSCRHFLFYMSNLVFTMLMPSIVYLLFTYVLITMLALCLSVLPITPSYGCW